MTGSSKTKYQELHLELASGEISILIGTHAILEDVVKFHNLGFVVIDEQHRFGVAQRAKMEKNTSSTCFSDDGNPYPKNFGHDFLWRSRCVDLSTNYPGRKPISTYHRFGFE